MESVYQTILYHIDQRLYPYTPYHLISFVIITAATYFIIDYFLKFKLIKWIYFSTLIVLAANLYNHGNKQDAVKDIFKLATI